MAPLAIEFEWDEKKAASNFQRHKITFNKATEVFQDPQAKEETNPYEGEERWTIIGTSQDGRLLLYVVYTIRNNGQTVRIISARPATKKERRSYELG